MTQAPASQPQKTGEICATVAGRKAEQAAIADPAQALTEPQPTGKKAPAKVGKKTGNMGAKDNAPKAIPSHRGSGPYHPGRGHNNLCGGDELRLHNRLGGTCDSGDPSQEVGREGLLLEIPGPEGAARADALAIKMRAILGEVERVVVARPMTMAELRVNDLLVSTTPRDVAAAIAAAGECSLGDVTTGDIRSSPMGLGTIWVRCPLVEDRKLELAQPPRRWHNCGSPEHRMVQCTSPPKCSGIGKPSIHRMGTREEGTRAPSGSSSRSWPPNWPL